ncbi:MAG TPA: erythromycin esterase family protein [Brevundimonas sp.]|nr:erythromycin esterase family protein [Brevundimonas sp.]
MAPDWRSSLAVAAALMSGCAEAQETPSSPLLSLQNLISAASPITGADEDYDRLLAAASGADFVLLGENSHGTADFYRERARITLRLIRDRGFRAVILEADWPEAERLNDYVRGKGGDASAAQALAGFDRFPRWMWRNAEFAALIEDIRQHNKALPPNEQVGVYGMDVYNLFEAAAAVTNYVARTAPPDADTIRRLYRCFQPYRGRPEAYGAATRRPSASCQDEAQAARELVESVAPNRPEADEERFSALRNASHVIAAEAYYRAAYSGAYSWNVRDRSMSETIEAVAAHLAPPGEERGRVIVWAHNTHVGDARATEMTYRGELNLGQLLKERHGDRVLSVGFLTYAGKVRAADEWGGSGRVYSLNPALPGSYSALLQAQGLDRALIILGDETDGSPLRQPALQRAVGVIYRPDDERAAHYFEANLSAQFDGLVFLKETLPVTPL